MPQKSYSMIKYSFTLTLVLLTTSLLHAQFFLDLGGGVSFTGTHFQTTLSADHYGVYTKGMINYMGGLRVGIPLRERLEMRTEVQYAVRGRTMRLGPGLVQLVYDRHHYLTVQPEIAWKMIRNRLVLRGGANFGYMSAAWSKSRSFEWQKYDRDYRKTLFNVIDVGPVFGLEWWFNHRIFIRTDFYHAISPVSVVEYTNMDAEPIAVHQERNRSITLGVGYRLFVH
jgi:hypothetical protein